MITRGTMIALIGLLISVFGHNSNEIFVFGLFVASFGIGLFNGSIYRIAITSTGLSGSMSAASLNIIQATMLAAGVEILNDLCSKFKYSTLSFSMLNLIVGIILSVLCFNYAKLVKSRLWQ
jgi:hypothetical protein